jgi:hypothetical protein
MKAFRAAVDLQLASMTEAKAISIVNRFYTYSYPPLDKRLERPMTGEPVEINRDRIVLSVTGPETVGYGPRHPGVTRLGTPGIVYDQYYVYRTSECTLYPTTLEVGEEYRPSDQFLPWVRSGYYLYRVYSAKPPVCMFVRRPDCDPAYVAAHRFLYPHIRIDNRITYR